MSMRLSPTTTATMAPPIVEAGRWIAGRSFPADRPLLNLSQAAPVDPPPRPLRQEIARIALEEPAAHLYGPVFGLPELRAEIASQWSRAYGGAIAAGNVAITQGCNQAFCAALTAVAAPGDAVIVAAPWYFNHVMHLSMMGMEVRPLPMDADMVPDPDRLAPLVDDRVAAIVLISPNNPTGAEYPPQVISAMARAARNAGIALILDETYRDFRRATARAHDLFTDPDWGDTLIQLYSFSKAYRLTGHRVGAMVAAPRVLAQAEKYLDTHAICANQIGQRAALFGLRHLSEWLAGERAEILARGAAMEAAFADGAAPGKLHATGAYFAWWESPWDIAPETLARRLVDEQSLLILPGAMFGPPSGESRHCFRIAFANTDAAGIGEFVARMNAFMP